MTIATLANTSEAPAYHVLNKIMEFPNEDQRLWWHSTAPMFAQMLQFAKYDSHSQYLHLTTYKKYVIPFLGVYPRNDKARWLSILTRYGTPFELSLNCSGPLVRYTFEPINAATGTPQDPFNTHAIWQSLEQLGLCEKTISLEWFNHFKADLTLNSAESSLLEKTGLYQDQIKTQNKLALDLDSIGGFSLKVYIYPALKSLATGKSIHELMFSSVYHLAKQYPGIMDPVTTLEDYIKSRGPQSTATPRLFSTDLVDPTRSRIKIYLLERMVSLEAMEELWTLGGRRQCKSTLAGLEMIRELWGLLKLPSGMQAYPAPYLPLGTIPEEQLPLMANYTIHHDDPMPEPQVYFTTFGMNDSQIADALSTFFDRRGWHDLARGYKNSLHSYYPNEDHDKVNYLHAYVSFSFRRERPYISVYLQSFETGNWVTCEYTPFFLPCTKYALVAEHILADIPIDEKIESI
ncbi:unnamed protein product [Penicillium olsonii]|nr:unnamed protein product [Penicillium olsonii]